MSYVVFRYGGFLGLSILASLVVTLTFVFFARATQMGLWHAAFLFPVLLTLLDPLDRVSFRPQLLSLLFLGILLYIISLSERQHPKRLYYAVPLFLVWGNIHGEFILGLAVLFFWGLLSLGKEILVDRARPRAVERARIGFLVLLLSALAASVNPFGIGVYTEAVRHFHNSMSGYITEWSPLVPLSSLWWRHIGVGVAIVVAFAILLSSRQVGDRLPYLCVAAVLFVLAFSSRRYAWPGYYLMLPVLTVIPDYFKPKTTRSSIVALVTALTLTAFVVVTVSSPLTDTTRFNWSRYCTALDSPCTPESAGFLARRNLRHNLLTFYGWGGWLIWNYPEIKPAIDGRMAFWRDQRGYSGFREYYWYEQNWEDVDKSRYDVVFMPRDRPIVSRLVDLWRQGRWRLVYTDRYAVVFQRVGGVHPQRNR